MGIEKEKWRAAAEAELMESFVRMNAVTETTPQELERAGGYAATLLMKTVWTV